MLKRSKPVWTAVLTLASVALISSAGVHAQQGNSAGKGKGAEKAQTAWTAPGHVNAKGNGHANHKGNGYGHGPHEGHDHDDEAEDQAPGKSAGKGKGAEKAQAAWSAPGHVNAKGNGHANHKGNGYGHGPHEGYEALPDGCYAAGAVFLEITGFDLGNVVDVDGNILAEYTLQATAESSTWSFYAQGDFTLYNYDVSAYSAPDAIIPRSWESGEFEHVTKELNVKLTAGVGDYYVEISLGLCGDLTSVDTIVAN